MSCGLSAKSSGGKILPGKGRRSCKGPGAAPCTPNANPELPPLLITEKKVQESAEPGSQTGVWCFLGVEARIPSPLSVPSGFISSFGFCSRARCSPLQRPIGFQRNLKHSKTTKLYPPRGKPPNVAFSWGTAVNRPHWPPSTGLTAQRFTVVFSTSVASPAFFTNPPRCPHSG